MIFFYFLISQMPLDDDPTWGSFLGMATAIKYIGLICILYAVIYIATHHHVPRFLSTIQARLFCIFLLVDFISYWTMGTPFSLRFSPFMIYLSMAFLFFVVLSLVDTIPHLRWTLLAAVGAMGWASLYVFRGWIRDPMWRPGGATGDANYFALDACLVLPLAFMLTWRLKVRWQRIFCLGCMLATVGATFLGGSRGGMLAIGAAFLWLLWHTPRRLRNFGLLIVLITPPLLLSPFSPVRRLLHPTYSDMNGEQDRLIAWHAGLQMIKAHPITGIGLGEFKPEMDRYAAPGVQIDSIAHNSYLEVAAETGIPNLLIFLAMIFFGYLSLSHVRRRTSRDGPPTVYLAALGLQAGLVGFVVGAFFLSAEHMKLFWLCMFLTMALPSFLRRSTQKQAAESPEKKSPRELAPEEVEIGLLTAEQRTPSF